MEDVRYVRNRMSALISRRRRFAVLLAVLAIGAGVGPSFVVLGAHAGPVADPVLVTNHAAEGRLSPFWDKIIFSLSIMATKEGVLQGV